MLKLRVDNLAAIWPNLHSAGFRHIVISGAISTQKELHLIREAVGHSVLTVVRLITPPSLLEARLRGRDVGRLLDDHLAVMPTIARSLDQSRIEDFRVMNDARPAGEVATRVLERVGWLRDANS